VPARSYAPDEEIGAVKLSQSIGPIRTFTPRWSRSIRLFKCFDDRNVLVAMNIVDRICDCTDNHPCHWLQVLIGTEVGPSFRSPVNL
jgi:hypothetical protein